jgi:MoxR-like ATPase
MKEFYIKRGIPRTLGILLSGSPGTGKTSTIKAISSHTNRHVINIKLNKESTQDDLFKLFHTKEIHTINGDCYIIPTEKRLYVIEDIDCLTDVVMARTEKEEEEYTSLEKFHDKVDGRIKDYLENKDYCEYNLG